MTITEKWARTAPAGPKLDRLCAEWMGDEINWTLEASRVDRWWRYSTSWRNAGPLLEAMGVTHLHDFRPSGTSTLKGRLFGKIKADTPQLAIARACAVLVTRGITRDQLERK